MRSIMKNEPQNQNFPINVTAQMSASLQQLQNCQIVGKTKAKRLDAKLVKWLFERFVGIWGEDWTRRIASAEKAAQKEWAEALAEYDEAQIAKAIEVARATKQWPLKISEFAALCNNAGNGTLIDWIASFEIAEKKIRKKFIAKSYQDSELERRVIVELQNKIITGQSDKADIAFCAHEDCRKYILVDFSGHDAWFCKEHVKQ